MKTICNIKTLLIILGILVCLLMIEQPCSHRTIIEKITSNDNAMLKYIDSQEDTTKEILKVKNEIIELKAKQDIIINEIKSVTYSKDISDSKVISNEHRNFDIGEECDLPNISTSVKLFTDYRAYNLQYTPHYRLQQVAWTDNQGLRRFNDDYIVALGSYYSVSIGDRFEITLDSGEIFTVIFGDGKWDVDCDERNMYTPVIDYEGEPAANLLEFIIDKDVLNSKVYEYGDLCLLDNFQGNIVKIIYLGRNNSADWDTYETK